MSIDFNYHNRLIDSFIFMKKIAQARRLLIVFTHRSKTQRRVPGHRADTDSALKIISLRINWCQLVTSWQPFNG